MDDDDVQVVEVTVSEFLSIGWRNPVLISANNSKIKRQKSPVNTESQIRALQTLQWKYLSNDICGFPLFIYLWCPSFCL